MDAVARCTGYIDGVAIVPTSPSSLCRQCDRRAIEGRKYCSNHAKTADDITTASHHWQEQRKNDPVRRLYKVKRWRQGTRMAVLRRDRLCVLCCHAASKVADHHPVSAHELVSLLGVNAFYDASRCRGLCTACHDSLQHK
jgi:hypothetical protein